MENTTVEKTQFTNKTDDTLLLVKGSSKTREDESKDVKKLAKAIVEVVQKHNTCNLRSVGAPAVNKATKSCIVATGNLSQKGIRVLLEPSFQTVKFGDSEKTAINIKVVVVNE